VAISQRRPEIVEQMIDHGADPNSAGPDMTPGLVWAAWRGDARLVRLLLAKGARTDVRSRASDTWGWTPLDAVMAAHDEPGADWRANPPVGSQALSDRLAIIDDLLDHGASPTDADRVESTPLHFAVSSDFVEGAQRLLERCAELRCNPSPLDVKDGQGRTPLERAQAKRKTQLIPTDIAQTDRMIATLEAWSRD
jgi:ankyrin repeat protein